MYAEIYENQWKWPSGWRDACYTRATAPVTSAEMPSPPLSSSLPSASAASGTPGGFGAPRKGGFETQPERVKLVTLHTPIPSWSDVAGLKSLHPVEMPAPSGCEWGGDWEIDCIPDADDEIRQGWIYGKAFPELIEASTQIFHAPTTFGGVKKAAAASALCKRLSKPDPSWEHPVRRRRWVRVYNKASTTATPAAADSKMGAADVLARKTSPTAKTSPAASTIKSEPFELKVDVPIRRATDLVSYVELVDDITRIVKLLGVMHKLVGRIGTEKDNIVVRKAIENLYTSLNTRIRPLPQCVATSARDASSKGSIDSAGLLGWKRLETDVATLRTKLQEEWGAAAAGMKSHPLAPGASKPAMATESKPSPPAASLQYPALPTTAAVRSLHSRPDAAPSGTAETSVQATMQVDALAAEVEYVSFIVEERSHEIDRVSGEVAEIADLFSELGVLVAGQTPALNKVDKNVADAKEHTLKALNELKKAEEYQRSGTCTIM